MAGVTRQTQSLFDVTFATCAHIPADNNQHPIRNIEQTSSTINGVVLYFINVNVYIDNANFYGSFSATMLC